MPDTDAAHTADRTRGRDFVRQIIDRDLESGRWDRVVTRFPPEPNGYLHIGHAKSICLNFGIAEEYGGRCHLRFDDTNPLTEEDVYVRSIREDVRWLGFDWGEHLYFASDYFGKLYDFAEGLIREGKAYVDSLSEDEIREYRGSLTEPGRPSPYRDRSVEENIDLFRRMRAGEFEEGEHVLRAKIDMADPNMIMRDPVLYRIRFAHHHRTGDDWCIYPLYDYAHCLEDAIEDVTHSLCTLEFVPNREIYDWLLDEVGFEEPRTHQYEFNRLNLDYTVLSKRKLIRLVREGHVDGWDDPRMPTIAGLRRRGVPPEAVRAFCAMTGVTRSDSREEVAKLEHAIRDTLNTEAPRVMGVLRPLRVVVANYPEEKEEWLDAPYFPRDVDREGSREVPFSRELLIERDDFATDPPKGWRRLAPGREVRLRYGYFLTCDEVVTDPDTGEVTELRCTYDPETRGGSAPDGRKPSGTIHWVSARHALPATVRLYDRLFSAPDPDDVPDGEDFTVNLNPDSLVVLEDARVEPSIADDDPGTRWQLERTGYFWRDPVDGLGEDIVLNRIVTLRDTWARRQAEAGSGAPGRGRAHGPAADGPSSGDAGRRAGATGRGRSGTAGSPAAGSTDHPEPVGGSPTTGVVGDPGEGRAIDDAPGEPGEDTGRAARDARRARDAELAGRFRRYREELGLDEDDADLLSGSTELGDFFEEALEAHDAPGPVAAWIVNELLRELKDRSLEELPFGGRALGALVRLVDEGAVSRVAAKEVFAEMVVEGGEPEAIVDREGLRKVSDRASLEPLVEEALEKHPGKVEEYRAGKTGLLGFFVGRVMRESGGAADPKLVNEMLRERLEGTER